MAIWLVFIYPRDGRVDETGEMPADSSRSAKESLAFAAFESPDGLRHSMPKEQYRDLLKHTFSQHNKFKVITHSSRFKNDYQFYLSYGFYPERLQGFDSVALAYETSLTLNPRLEGSYHLSFHALAPSGEAEISVNVGGKNIAKHKIAGALDVPDSNSFFYRNILRYFKINYTHDLKGWQPIKINLRGLEPKELISISCSSPGRNFPCVLSEPLLTEEKNPEPNIIVIVLDTLRHDGLNNEKMPNLDAFRRIANEYTRAISPGNMTGPSTNAILSCQRPSHIEKVAFSYGIRPEDREAFYQMNKPSFTWKLRQKGYYTAMIGNISLISEVYGVGVNHGFYENISIEQEAYDTPKIVRETHRWLNIHEDEHFFLYLHLDGGHAPYRPPLAYFPNPIKNLNVFSMPSILKYLYAAELSYTDKYLGEIFADLKNRDLFDSSNIIITSDHADQQQEHEFTHNIAGKIFKGAYFDHGATLLNDEIHVPLLIKPAFSKSNHLHNNYVSNIGIGPTLLSWAGGEPLPYCEATPLLEAGVASNAILQPNKILGFEGFRKRGILFQQRYKYIRSYETTEKRLYQENQLNHARTFILEPEQLYDLVNDPDEKSNLIDSDLELKKLARQKFAAYYGFSEGYKISIHPTSPSKIRIVFPSQIHDLDYDHQLLSSSLDNTRLELRGQIEHETEVLVHGFLKEWPRIYINEKLPLEYASRDQLPLTNIASLPVEKNDADKGLEVSANGSPYIVLKHLYFDNMNARSIKSGNVEFEQVLRQWGYLQDDQK